MGKRDVILKEYAGKIESGWFPREGWFTLKSLVPGLSARGIAAEYGIEELAAYKHRSRVEIDKMRGFEFHGL
jgi:hypothetical protein